jgi:hypothetical protein
MEVHMFDARGPTAPASIAGKAPAMTAAQVPSLGRPPRRTTRKYGAVAAGIALVLLVAAGLLLWQGTRGDAATGPAETAVTTPTVPVVAPRDQPGPTYFLVGSQAQADAIQRGIDDAAALRDAQGATPLTASVLRFPSVEAEAFFWSTMAEQDHASLGLDSVTVVDLRTPAVRVPASEPAAVSDQELDQRAQPAPAAAARGICQTADPPAEC